MFVKFHNIDFYVYVCLKNTTHKTAKCISHYLKIDYPHIYNSLNRLIKSNKIYKTNSFPSEFYIISEQMENLEKQLTQIKEDPALMLKLFRSMMDSSKILRKLLIKNIVKKESQKDACKEWLVSSIKDKNEWINKFYLGEGNNIDTFINAIYLLKNTKDEKIMLKYLVECKK